jgi:N-glycosylase/DNA lyase
MAESLIQLDSKKTPFNLNCTLSCGQAFRWEKRRNLWFGVVSQKILMLRQFSGFFQFRIYPEYFNADFVTNYFRLIDDLPNIYSKITKDEYVREAVEKFYGLRLLRQEPWECLISYICATNKNIPAIRDIINNMCRRFGEKIKFNEETFFTFPKPEALAKANLRKLRMCKLGFRTERIKQTATLIYEGTFELEALKKMSYEKAKEQLLTLPGVGPKVADCVLLFSLDKLEAFPIDVWMKRIVLEKYSQYFEQPFVKKITLKKSITPRDYRIINSFGRKYFGEFVGYAQEYLYHFKRCKP